MRLVLNSIVGFLVLLFIQSCADEAKTKVANSAEEFMAAYHDQDIARMRVVYPGIDNIEIFYASDTSFIESITPLSSSGEYQVEVVSLYLNQENTPEIQNVTLFFVPVDNKEQPFQISDSYGIASWSSYPHYNFAVQTGCMRSSNDLTDQQAMQRLRVAKDLLFYFSKLMYQDLEENIRLTQTTILEQKNQRAHGKAIVENQSDYTLPDLKYIIVYYDENDRKIGEEGGWVTQSPIESGQKIAFDFVTSFDKEAATADFKLDFDLNLIMEFVMGDDVYTGREYEEFVTKKLIDI